MGGSGKSMALQQYETLECQLQHLKEMRKWCILSAAAPTVGWALWGAGGAAAMGNAVGGLMALAVATAVVLGLWIKNKWLAVLAQVGAFLFALFGGALPMLIGGWILIGKLVVVLVIAGVAACYALVKNEIDTARTLERLDELAPKVGKRKR